MEKNMQMVITFIVLFLKQERKLRTVYQLVRKVILIILLELIH